MGKNKSGRNRSGRKPVQLKGQMAAKCDRCEAVELFNPPGTQGKAGAAGWRINLRKNKATCPRCAKSAS